MWQDVTRMWLITHIVNNNAHVVDTNNTLSTTYAFIVTMNNNAHVVDTDNAYSLTIMHCGHCM